MVNIQYLQRFKHPRWCGISFIDSSIYSCWSQWSFLATPRDGFCCQVREKTSDYWRCYVLTCHGTHDIVSLVVLMVSQTNSTMSSSSLSWALHKPQNTRHTCLKDILINLPEQLNHRTLEKQLGPEFRNSFCSSNHGKDEETTQAPTEHVKLHMSNIFT